MPVNTRTTSADAGSSAQQPAIGRNDRIPYLPLAA
jgi:hypothetical protein